MSKDEESLKIIFDEEVVHLNMNCNYALRISLRMIGTLVYSYGDILYYNIFQKLGLLTNNPTQMFSSLMGFTNYPISPFGTINLYIMFEMEPYSKAISTKFIIIDIPSVNNVIIG